MSYVNALIAQGGTPFDVAKYTNAGQAGQIAKQNDLINLGKQKELDEFDLNAPVRAAEREDKISDFARKSTIVGAKELAAYFDAADQAETPQQRLAVISKTLDFLDTRAENIKARGGNPVDTIAAKNALENYIANPAMGQEELANVMNITKKLAAMDIGDGKENRIQSVKRDTQGKTWGIYNDGSTKDLGIDQGADMVYQKVTESTPNGDLVDKVIALPRTISVDGTTGFGQPVPVDTGGINADEFLSALNPNQVLGGQKTNSPTVVSSSINSADAAATRAEKVAEATATGTANATIATAVPVAVAKAEGERKAIAPENLTRAYNKMAETDSIMEEIGFIRSKASNWSTGIGALMRHVPMTDAKAMAGAIKTMQGNLGFTQLQNMRELAKTGGALGQVSNIELGLLISTVASLDQEMGLEDFNRALKKIERHYWRAKDALQNSIAYNKGELSQEEYVSKLEEAQKEQGKFANIKVIGDVAEWNEAFPNFKDGDIYIDPDGKMLQWNAERGVGIENFLTGKRQ
jgi:hypothetical protein